MSACVVVAAEERTRQGGVKGQRGSWRTRSLWRRGTTAIGCPSCCCCGWTGSWSRPGGTSHATCSCLPSQIATACRDFGFVASAKRCESSVDFFHVTTCSAAMGHLVSKKDHIEEGCKAYPERRESSESESEYWRAGVLSSLCSWLLYLSLLLLVVGCCSPAAGSVGLGAGSGWCGTCGARGMAVRATSRATSVPVRWEWRRT